MLIGSSVSVSADLSFECIMDIDVEGCEVTGSVGSIGWKLVW